MFDIWSPISYNTNLDPILSHYGLGFCGGNCNNWASHFNPPWVYNNGIGMRNPNFPNSYQCGNYYPNIFSLNYTSQYNNYYSNPWNNIFNFLPQTQAVQQYLPPVQLKTTTTISNPIKSSPAVNEVKSEPKMQENTQTAQMSYAKSDLGNEFVSTAKKYSDCKESDGSHRRFCTNPTCKLEDPYDQEWCTDFVTYVVNETYKQQGKSVPSGFGSHDVKTLKNWAIDTNHFIRTSNKAKKAEYIAQNIKVGDIIIFNENNASHTGFVTKIDKNNGTIHTIEGNRDDKVSEYAYSPNLPDISGFIRLTS